MGLKEVGEGQETLCLSVYFASVARTAGKWVPTSELAPLVPLVGSSSFAENSIIMIAYDVNDAPRQQLFPSERARGAAGPDAVATLRVVANARTRPWVASSSTVQSPPIAWQMGFDRLAGAGARKSFSFPRKSQPFNAPSVGGRAACSALSIREFPGE